MRSKNVVLGIRDNMSMEKICIWGTGRVADEVLKRCDIFKQYDLLGFIDNDERKQGQTYNGRPVYAPEKLHDMSIERIIILTDSYAAISWQIRQCLKINHVPIEDKNFFYRQGVLNRYRESCNAEIREILDYITENTLEVFNYPFAKKYETMACDVEYDSVCGLFYVMHKDKRMYFARSLNTPEAVVRYYRSILLEQDGSSPHRYLDSSFQVSKGDIVVDVGVAEGNFALEVIDSVSKIYLIESDEQWIEALKETFRSYEDKVVIIKKYVSSIDIGSYSRLDTLFPGTVNFIKMDIEGNEWDALLGAEQLFRRSSNLKCAICSYHTDCDEALIKKTLSDYGMRCTTTPGYMWFPSIGRNGFISDKLCRGIVRGVK